MTILDVIKSSLRVCHVLQKGEPPSADEAQDTLQALQFMLDACGADNLMVWSQVQESLILTAGKRTYTIGASATLDWNTVYPYKINSAFVRDLQDVDTTMDVVVRTEYDAYSDKLLANARPLALYYEPGVASQVLPTGTISIYPIPDGSTQYTLFINSIKPLTSLLTTTANFTLLAPYEEFVKYNLALRIWDEFHEKEPVPQHIITLAKESKALIERNSLEFEISALSVPGVRSGLWNILSDIGTD